MSKAGETRVKLMETAAQLIWQRSYAAVGVAEICKAAGVTKGGFYHHFESKADLFYEASEHYWQDFKKDLEHIYSPAFEPLEQLDNLIEMVVDRQDDDFKEDDNPVAGCPFFTAGSQVGAGDEKVRDAAIEMSEKSTRYTTALVRNLKGAGLLNGDPEPAMLARMITHYIHGLLIHGRVHRSLEAVKLDLREGLYRVLDLKLEYRTMPEAEKATVAAT